MGLAHDLGKTIGHALAPVRAGDDGLASRMLAVLDRRTLDVTSSAFTDGGSLPRAFTGDTESPVSPPIAWSNVPDGTQSLVVIAEDSDAPTPKPFVHWLVYGIPASVGSIQGAQRLEGKNSMLSDGFTPAAPPAGHGMHHYHFQVFALDVAIDLGRGAGRSSLLEEMRGHVLGWGEIVGTYERS
jgi:hypothetical protein